MRNQRLRALCSGKLVRLVSQRFLGKILFQLLNETNIGFIIPKRNILLLHENIKILKKRFCNFLNKKKCENGLLQTLKVMDTKKRHIFCGMLDLEILQFWIGTRSEER